MDPKSSPPSPAGAVDELVALYKFEIGEADYDSFCTQTEHALQVIEPRFVADIKSSSSCVWGHFMRSSLQEGLCSITATTGQSCWAAAVIECSVQWLSAGVTVNGAYSFDGCFGNDAAGNLFMHGRSNGLMLPQTAFLQEVGLLVQNGHDGSAYLFQDAIGCEYLTRLGFGPEVRHPVTHRTTVYTSSSSS